MNQFLMLLSKLTRSVMTATSFSESNRPDLEYRLDLLEKSMSETRGHLLAVQMHLRNCIDHQVSTSDDLNNIAQYVDVILQSLNKNKELSALPRIKTPPDDDFWN